MNKPAGRWLMLIAAGLWAAALPLRAGPPRTEKRNPLKLVGMRGLPPVEEIQQVQKSGRKFLPFVDNFGQYRHRQWPGKTTSIQDLLDQARQEQADLQAHPGPRQWDRYGGWADGPRLQATGFFRVEKYNGKWWLVDPEGRLFWSHGLDGVHWYSAVTPISHRENYFQLPPDKPPFNRFYGKGRWAPHGFYKDKGQYRTFNFTGLNLYHKYGKNWVQRMAEQAHLRLRSWGFNTLGNWSAQTVYQMRRTPYVVPISFASPPIQASSGWWGQFPDPYHPDFRNHLRARMEREKNRSAGDPWCLGYFVGNELSWGKALSLAQAVMASGPDQPAKAALLEKLKRKYKSPQQLNKTWAKHYKQWADLLADRIPPKTGQARTDLADFETALHQTFFRICREEIARVAPQQLYLGCRFAWTNESAIRAAARYCHVISFNRYADDLAGFTLPAGLDKPVLIGEFHFGALDRGLFHTGLRGTDNQNQRAQAYQQYVRSALQHPLLVGAHWFQYGDQPVTGRGDGENYQIGFVDVCDRPYPEMIQASRQLAQQMYRLRAANLHP